MFWQVRALELYSGIKNLILRLPLVLKVYREAGSSYLALGLVLIIYDGAAGAVSLWVMKLIIDEAAALVTSGWDLERVGFFVCLQVLIWGAASMAEVLWRPMTGILGERATHITRKRVAEKASRIPYHQYEDPRFYNKIEAAQRAQEWPEYTSILLFSSISMLVRVISTALVVTTISIWISPLLILVSVPFLICQMLYIVDGHHLFKHQSSDRRKLNYYSKVLSSRDYAKELRVFDYKGHWLDKYEFLWQKCYDKRRHLFLSKNKSVLFWDLPAMVAAATVYMYVVWLAVQGAINLSSVALGLAGIFQLREAIRGLGHAVVQVFRSSFFVSDFFDFIELSEDKGSVFISTTSRRSSGNTLLQLRNVCYRYPGTPRDALQMVDLDIEKGERIALVGRNGAGKTTLVKIICGLLPHSIGDVLLSIDGKTFDDAAMRRGIVSAMFQDLARYDGTIRENIELGDTKRKGDAELLHKVLAQSGVDAISKGLSGGNEQIVGREIGGVDLSVGQWQHIALARALFKSQARLLVMDEPSAAMDAEAEERLLRLMEDVTKDRTCLIVSHRLSTVQVATRIIVLDNGRIVEQGKHEDLIGASGIYAEFFNVQSARYAGSQVVEK